LGIEGRILQIVKNTGRHTQWSIGVVEYWSSFERSTIARFHYSAVLGWDGLSTDPS